MENDSIEKWNSSASDLTPDVKKVDAKKRKQFSIVLTRIYLTSLIRGPRK